MGQEISDLIKSDAVNKTINLEKQSRHVRESAGYVVGRSYLLPGVDAQELVDKYHGTGETWVSKSGVWKQKETVRVSTNIGVNIDLHTAKETITNRFTIHYSRTGSHIVPSERVD